MNDDTGKLSGEFARIANKQVYLVFRMEIFSSFEF